MICQNVLNFLVSCLLMTLPILHLITILKLLLYLLTKNFIKLNFFCSHRLSLHPEKTKFMIVSNSIVNTVPNIVINYNSLLGVQDPSKIYKINYINISSTPYAKFLGVLIDPKLKFKPHVASITKKVSTTLYF